MSYEADIAPLDGLALLNVRSAADAVAGFERALGFKWPETSSVTQGHDDAIVMRLGPDQWLVRAPQEAEGPLLDALVDAARGRFAAVTIVSDHYRGFRTSGSQARDILAQACTLDLDRLSSGECARTAFARIWAVLYVVEKDRSYDVLVESSHARYTAQWLAAAKGENRG